MNRQLFVTHFGSMLSTIKKNNLEEIEKEGFTAKPDIHEVPYDELAGYEIEYLMKKEFNVDPTRYVALGAEQNSIVSASESLKVAATRKRLLEEFATISEGKTNSLEILFNVDANHWVTIKATRQANVVTFEIFDSLGKRNWQDADEASPINTNILKNLSIYLTTPAMHS